MSATVRSVQQQPSEPAKQTTPLENEDSGISARENIARLAYALWEQRGCPVGSSEFDWLEAEQQLKSKSAS